MSGGGFTVTGVTSGAIGMGQVLSGVGVSTGTTVDGIGTGTGGDGTYAVSISQSVSSETITATGAGITAGNAIAEQLTGTPGGIGTYLITDTESLPAGYQFSMSGGGLTVSSVASGNISLGYVVAGTGVTANQNILAFRNRRWQHRYLCRQSFADAFEHGGSDTNFDV